MYPVKMKYSAKARPTLEVARYLKGKKNLTVITNALNITNELAGEQDITVVITGGLLRHSELSMIGHITEQTLKELRADKVIMDMCALNLSEDLTNDYLSETMTDRAIISFALKVILRFLVIPLAPNENSILRTDEHRYISPNFHLAKAESPGVLVTKHLSS